MTKSSPSAFSQVTGQMDKSDVIQNSVEKTVGYDLSADNLVSFVSKSSKLRPVPEKNQPEPIPCNKSNHLDHIATLSAMDLRKRYPREANSHKNMLSRRKTKGATVHPDFAGFESFLRFMGPMPAKKATLDRIDNSDPEYAPGKVRWADKKTQNSNKSDTIIIHDAVTSQTYSVSQLAKRHSVSPDTIRKRKQRGWTDAEIIAGAKTKPVNLGALGTLLSPFPVGLYSQYQIAILMRPEGALTVGIEISFHREAHWRQAHRADTGEEYFPALYDEMAKIDRELVVGLTRDQYERHITKLWPTMRPHIVYANLTPAQQQLVAKIDPEYVARKTASNKTVP